MRAVSAATSRPQSQRRLPRGKTLAGLAEGGRGDRPAERGGDQAQDLVQAVPAGVQGDRDHQPQGGDGAQLAFAPALAALPSPGLQVQDAGAHQPLNENLHIGRGHGRASGRMASKVALPVCRTN